MACFVDSIFSLNPAFLVSEDAACDAFVAARWPDGIIPCRHCGFDCIRRGAQLVCTGDKPHRATIFFDTPLGTKRRPNVRATLIALRQMAMSPRSISARELARETGMATATCWRHLHSLRAALPITALRSRAPRARGVVRSWYVATFHGISKGWHHRYEQEIASRWHFGAYIYDFTMELFIDRGHPVTLRAARRKHGPAFALKRPPLSKHRRNVHTQVSLTPASAPSTSSA